MEYNSTTKDESYHQPSRWCIRIFFKPVKKFYYLLSKENLIAKDGESEIEKLYRNNTEEEERISNKFYAEYKAARNHLFEELAKITDYDFDTDLNVNILGHIFEQSISDLEEIKAEINGKRLDKKKGKRKKEGIYYTPEYITRYIVENAIGGWLEDRKKELGFYDLVLPPYSWGIYFIPFYLLPLMR